MLSIFRILLFKSILFFSFIFRFSKFLLKYIIVERFSLIVHFFCRLPSFFFSKSSMQIKSFIRSFVSFRNSRIFRFDSLGSNSRTYYKCIQFLFVSIQIIDIRTTSNLAFKNWICIIYIHQMSAMNFRCTFRLNPQF